MAIGDQPATLSSGGNAFGYEASEVPELERKEFITKVWTWVQCLGPGRGGGGWCDRSNRSEMDH